MLSSYPNFVLLTGIFFRVSGLNFVFCCRVPYSCYLLSHLWLLLKNATHDLCLTLHHQLGKVIQMNQLDATIIYWSIRSAQHVSGNILSIIRSVRLRYLQHMVSCCKYLSPTLLMMGKILPETRWADLVDQKIIVASSWFIYITLPNATRLYHIQLQPFLIGSFAQTLSSENQNIIIFNHLNSKSKSKSLCNWQFILLGVAFCLGLPTRSFCGNSATTTATGASKRPQTCRLQRLRCQAHLQVCRQFSSRSICSCSKAVYKPICHIPLLSV